MAVAYDAFSSATEGTGNLEWAHSPSGTPKGVLVLIAQYNSGTDQVTSVTYGGVAMTEVALSPLLKSATEAMAVYGYFLGSGIPSGIQAIVVTVGGSAAKRAACITVTAATGGTAVQDTTTISSDSLLNPSGTLSLGGVSCFCAEVFTSGAQTVGGFSALSNWTERLEHDFGSEGAGWYTYNTVGTADVTFGYTASAEDVVCLGVAIKEVEVKTGLVTAVQAELTTTQKTGRVTAVQGSLTSTEKTGRTTAVQAALTTTEKTGRITAGQAALTTTEKTGRVAAVQADLTSTEKTGRIVAVEAGVDWDGRGARVVAVEAGLTYSAKTGLVAAVQAALDLTEVVGRVAAVQAAVDWTEVAGRIAAVQADVGFDAIAGRIAAAQAALDSTEVTADLTAVQADLTYDMVVARVAAAQAALDFDPVVARVVAVEAGIEYSIPSAQEGRIAAVEAVLTWDPVVARIVAAEADVQSSPVAARIVAVHVDIEAESIAARLTALEASQHYDPVTGTVTALQADVDWTVAADIRVTAIDAEVNLYYDPQWAPPAVGRLIAVEAGLTYSDRRLRNEGVPWWSPALAIPPPRFRMNRPPILSMPQRQGIAGGRPRPTVQLPLFGLLWATWNPADETDATALELAWATQGYNWTIWEDALTTRILARGGNPATEIEKSGGRVRVKGQAVLDLASMFDVVVFGHWLPLAFVQAIKARSTAPDGTRVYFWTDFESIWNRFYWPETGWQEGVYGNTLRNQPPAGRGAILRTPLPNQLGAFETCIDKYEGSPPYQWNELACPHLPPHNMLSWAEVGSHTWDLDIYWLTGSGVAGSAKALETVALFETSLLSGWAGDGPLVVDGLLFDNLLEAPYKGQATNDYPDGWSDEYRAGWRAFLKTWKTRLETLQAAGTVTSAARFMAANGPTTCTVYEQPDCPTRYIEHAFRRPDLAAKTWSDVETMLGELMLSGVNAVLAFNGNVGNQWIWGTSSGPGGNYGTWAQVVAELQRLGTASRTYVAAWQTLTDAFAFWQEGFREPS